MIPSTSNCLNNTIQVTVDGIQSSITVPAAHYTSGCLATAIQTAINADSNLTTAGKSV